jgi:hypothetical protein
MRRTAIINKKDDRLTIVLKDEEKSFLPVIWFLRRVVKMLDCSRPAAAKALRILESAGIVK